MKISMLGHKRVPSREGGVEVVVEELSVRMVAAGHEVTLFNRGGNHVSGKEFNNQKLDNYKGIKLKTALAINIKGLAAMSSSFFGAVKVAFGKYDVVHFHAEGPCAMLWLPKLFGKRCVATVHGLDWQREKWKDGLGAKYIKLGEKVAVKFANEIIVLSRNVQKYFKDTYNRETVFIPNGVNRPEILPAYLIKEKFSLNKDEYILFLGRIVPEKGVKYLIQAFKEVKTDKKLVIAGGSSDTDSYFSLMKKLAKEDERIIFTGFVSGQILEELYSNAYVYVLPSDLEGMPLSLLEAMSYGNCCLVSSIDECSEVVEDKAVTFKKSDVIDLQNKVQSLCDNEDIVKKYKAGSSRYICEKYNWDNVVRQTLKCYEAI